MNPDIPPIAKSQRSGFLDETVLNCSSKLHENKIFGYAISILYNINYIYLWYLHTNLFSIINFTILYFLLVLIIQVKILRM